MYATQSKIQTLELLYDQQDTTTPAANARANIGEEAAAELTLLRNEVAEIKFIELETPLDVAGGAAEALEYIRPIIDGEDYRGGDKLRLRADNDSLQMVPRISNAKNLEIGDHASRKLWTMGLTLPELMKFGIDVNPSLIIRNSTIKVREAGTINAAYEVGNTAITDNFRLKMYGVRYKDFDVAEFFMQRVYSGGRRVSLLDAKTGRDFSTTVSPISFRAEDWTKLLGGNNQKLNADIEIDYFNYWARNATATVAGVDYNLSFDDNQVDDREENMDLEIDDETLWLIVNFGLRANANHLRTTIRVNDRIMFKDEIRDNINNMNFGRITANSPGAEPSDHEYSGLPTIDPVFIHNETGVVQIRDNGTPIPDGSDFGNGDLIVWSGYRIKDSSYKGKKPTIFEAGGLSRGR